MNFNQYIKESKGSITTLKNLFNNLNDLSNRSKVILWNANGLNYLHIKESFKEIVEWTSSEVNSTAEVLRSLGSDVSIGLSESISFNENSIDSFKSELKSFRNSLDEIKCKTDQEKELVFRLIEETSKSIYQLEQ